MYTNVQGLINNFNRSNCGYRETTFYNIIGNTPNGQCGRIRNTGILSNRVCIACLKLAKAPTFLLCLKCFSNCTQSKVEETQINSLAVVLQ